MDGWRDRYIDVAMYGCFSFVSRFLIRILKRLGYCLGALFVFTFVVIVVSGVEVRLPVTTVGKSGVQS